MNIFENINIILRIDKSMYTVLVYTYQRKCKKMLRVSAVFGYIHSGAYQIWTVLKNVVSE